jgi:hypothetical protein
MYRYAEKKFRLHRGEIPQIVLPKGCDKVRLVVGAEGIHEVDFHWASDDADTWVQARDLPGKEDRAFGLKLANKASNLPDGSAAKAAYDLLPEATRLSGKAVKAGLSKAHWEVFFPPRPRRVAPARRGRGSFRR